MSSFPPRGMAKNGGGPDLLRQSLAYEFYGNYDLLADVYSAHTASVQFQLYLNPDNHVFSHSCCADGNVLVAWKVHFGGYAIFGSTVQCSR